MEFAIIETGAKQYKVARGDRLQVECLLKKTGAVVSFKPLFYWDGKTAQVGRPYLDGKTVETKIVSETKGAKVRTVKHKAKKRYRRSLGHRQNYSVVEILNIK